MFFKGNQVCLAQYSNQFLSQGAIIASSANKRIDGLKTNNSKSNILACWPPVQNRSNFYLPNSTPGYLYTMLEIIILLYLFRSIFPNSTLQKMYSMPGLNMYIYL